MCCFIVFGKQRRTMALRIYLALRNITTCPFRGSLETQLHIWQSVKANKTRRAEKGCVGAVVHHPKSWKCQVYFPSFYLLWLPESDLASSLLSSSCLFCPSPVHPLLAPPALLSLFWLRRTGYVCFSLQPNNEASLLPPLPLPFFFSSLDSSSAHTSFVCLSACLSVSLFLILLCDSLVSRNKKDKNR